MAWYVLYTKPRNEKKVSTMLATRGFNVFCPLKVEVKQWSDRKKKVSEPVFRSYVFVELPDYEKYNIDVLMVPGVVRFIWWNGQPGVVRDDEIRVVKDFLEDYKDAEVLVTFSKGQNVVIKEGLLKEKKARVISVDRNKAVLQLYTLGLNLIAKVPVQSLAAVS